jgi:hypothetical protein
MEGDREKAIALVNAYFDGKDIFMRDPDAGVPNWVSVNHPEYWSYLTMFCKNTDKYQVIEKPKKQLECKVGDCFIETDSSDGWINLYKITLVGPTNVEFEEIDVHTVSGDINLVDDYISKEIAYEHFKPISVELYDKVHKIVTSLNTTIDIMYKDCVIEIKELCQSVKQNQEKQ